MSELLKINVNDHTERKNGLTYLSWAWAWAEVLRIDPAATWQAHEWGGLPAMFLPDGSAMVKVSVTIKGEAKTCPLPVMDHRNKAIKNPDAFAINTATMRALAKAIGMHGLGLYIYAGEDLPESDATDEKPPLASVSGIKRGVAQDVLSTSPPLDAEMMRYLDELADTVQAEFLAAGPKAAYEVIERENLEDIQKIYLSTKLPSGTRNPIKAYSRELHAKPKAA